MARRMLHYWLCPTDLGKTGSNKIVKNGPKFFCECPRRVNKYYKEVHDSLNFQDFQCPFIKKKLCMEYCCHGNFAGGNCQSKVK